jgi:hypothetical protein
LRRAELAILAAVAFTGCMRIYPDPDLPDVKVRWGVQDCRPGTRDVAVRLTGLDATSEETRTVACTDLVVVFADVARQRFHVGGDLLDLAGNVFTTSEGSDVDLRNGFDQSAGLYFDGFSNFRVAYVFDGGATCGSLGATSVEMAFSLPGEPDVDAFQFPCELARYTGSAPPGTYTARLRALASEQVVAASPETAPFVITESGFADLGVVTLTPCSAACP